MAEGMLELETARRQGNEECRYWMEKVKERTRMRRSVGAWFSDAKWAFLRGEVPLLVDIGRMSYEHMVGKGGEEFSIIFPLLAFLIK